MMQPQDDKKFAGMMVGLGEAFDKLPGKAKIELYFRALSDLTIEQIEMACVYIVNTRTITGTFPLVAELRDAVAQHEGGSLEDRALDAWAKLSWAMNYVYKSNSVAFDDPLIHHAILLWAGGWPQVWQMDWTLDQVVWRQKEFVASYKAAARNPHLPSHPEYLIGSHEAHNAENWPEHVPPPVLVVGSAGQYRKLVGPAPKMIPATSNNLVISKLDGRGWRIKR
jgi:hypothetical protein